MESDLRPKNGKVALVTGAAGGLGRAFAHRLALEGAVVVAVDYADDGDLIARLRAAGAPDACYFRTDLSDESQIIQMTGDLLDRVGRCDIIVNNAGIVPHKPLGQTSYAEWRKTMAVNVDSMFLICQALIPSMAENSYGRIVNISSDTLGAAVGGFSAYMASKGAVIGLTRALANEFGAQGIVANCIAPGLTRTARTSREPGSDKVFEMISRAQAIKREAVPEDLVGAMSFLTSDDMAFMTGQTLIVDGGLFKAI